MTQDIQLRVAPKVAANPLMINLEVSNHLGIDANRIKHIRILRRSIDARQRRVMVNLTVRAHIDALEPDPEFVAVDYPDVAGKPQAIVVGAGPAGLFAALRLIELGIRPIVLERGKDVDSRRLDMAAIAREGRVDPDSNYCFGEGGAGAFSDGKLYTRSKKRGSIEKILNVFCQHGASTDILIDAHPHIGTDRLPSIIKAMRQTIVRCGGEVRFGQRVERLTLSDGRVTGVATADGTRLSGPVILATGHSARDVYRMLHDSGVRLEAKGLAIGVRLEHPQSLIDSLQYHNPQGRGRFLPAAEYSMLTRVDDRAVYSFCMCPGGVVIPAASAPGQLVVNGMSPSSRGGRWANSGMVVEVLPEDVPVREGEPAELRLMRLQEEIEHAFFAEANSHTTEDDAHEAPRPTQNAPAQRMTDFTESKLSASLPPTSYAPGIHPARIDRILPRFISRRLQEGFKEFGKKQRGFLTDQAVLIGAETRTSSPVRIPRDPLTLAHADLPGLFPCGEGAGYAGGIVSAAIDGERCAEALAASLT